MCLKLPNLNERLPIFQTSLETLSVRFYDQPCGLDNLFQRRPCLRHVTIDLGWRFLNGHQWKEMIAKYLPNLKNLHFSVFNMWRGIAGNDAEVEEQLDTFRTPFWLQKHQWHVCSDWEGAAYFSRGSKRFYTLPYAFSYFGDVANGIRRSTLTCSHQDKHWSFHRLRKFEGRSLDTNRQCQCPVDFLNIENLRLSLPQPDRIWRLILSLDHLT